MTENASIEKSTTRAKYLVFDPGVLTKICNKCGTEKVLTDFHYNKRSKDNRLNQCKKCVNKKNQEYKLKAKQDKTAWRRSQYSTELRKYGLTIEQYEELLDKQHGICAICDCEPFFKKLSIDHNHITGKVRGLICNNCNIMLGNAFDDPTILIAAADYLKERNE
jgi:hypothetical protein